MSHESHSWVFILDKGLENFSCKVQVAYILLIVGQVVSTTAT